MWDISSYGIPGTVLPAWVTNLYGDEITIGGENYTVYDIDNPNVREMWEQILKC